MDVGWKQAAFSFICGFPFTLVLFIYFPVFVTWLGSWVQQASCISWRWLVVFGFCGPKGFGFKRQVGEGGGKRERDLRMDYLSDGLPFGCCTHLPVHHPCVYNTILTASAAFQHTRSWLFLITMHGMIVALGFHPSAQPRRCGD